jgi:predicted membrane protein
MEPQARVRITGQLILGIAIGVLGLLFTLDNLEVLRARDYLRYWPVALIAVGLVHIVQARTSAGAFGGIIWVLLGSALLGNRLGFLALNPWNYWPLLLVFVGGRIVWQSISVHAPSASSSDPNTTVSALAVMGGFDRKIASTDFRGGELTAFMGGGKLDLRGATPAGGQAIINVFAVMGGFEIFVPETWSVIIEATPFMGGIEDKTRPLAGPSTARLVVRGFVMMSGVEIKN